MTFKTILAHCDASPKLAHCLEIAADLAQRNDAHLVGAHVRPPFEVPAYVEAGMPMDLLFKDHENAVKADEDKSRSTFQKAMLGRRLSHEFRVSDGYIDREFVLQARYADLVVLGQTEPDAATPTPSNLPETVAFSSGRPSLIVPLEEVRRPPGTNVMLCWNATRESARAAADALPFLRAAKEVKILVVDPHTSPRGHGAEPGADVAQWLARHDVKVTVQRDVAADGDVGGVILSRARDFDTDLIVMGVYGHSRLRELVLGGASRTLLSSTTLPLFISH